MLRKVRPTVHSLALVFVAACSGRDAPTGNPSISKSASLTVSVTNVPVGVTASASVTGPNGFSRVIAGNTTITGLTAGTYTVSATTAETDAAIYAPMPASQNVELAAGSTRAVDVSYALASGTLEIAITGLPAQRDAAVTITGPNNYSRQVTRSETLPKLAAGPYIISAVAVTADGDGYSVASMPRSVDITPSAAAHAVTIAYVVATGRLQVHANGLPQGATPTFQVSGPYGFTHTASAGQVLVGLAPGTYAITAPNVVMGTSTYVPGTASVSLAIVPSLVAAQANVAYTLSDDGGGGGSGPINLTIDNLYITQAVQTYVGDVPLISGRDGLVRVFVKASTANTAQPQVRVRLYNGSSLLHTLTLNAPKSAVPTVVDDATLTSAWYGVVPATYIQPGLRVLADVDPVNAVTEGSESDNTWPASGSAATMIVKTVPTFAVRFVPVRQSNDIVGNVSSANTAAFLNDLRRMYPLGAVDADVRATYTTSAPVLQANDNNGAWNTVLSEVNALRAVDGSSRYYYGVVKTGYSSGVAGMGYLGAPAAIGWDNLPSGADVMAHELGHNWGRHHSPCGGAGSPDPSYPYSGGRIGVSGFDLTTSVFKAPSVADVMGYCSLPWVSDYTYKGIMSYRETHPMVASAAAMRSPEPGLLIWGRIAGGQLVLEPAFEIVARPMLPTRSGPYRVEGLAEDGSLAFSFGFDGDAVDHAHPDDRHFAFVLPRAALGGRVLATLRLRAHGRVAELKSSPASMQALAADDAESPRVRRLGAKTARVHWASAAVRGVMVRDTRSGDVLAFARGGATSLVAPKSDVELVLSDGVRSRSRRVAVR
ncbi:MAG: hypothetical protein ACREOG_06915 [Gemmatimonadaceae bacterium]